MGMHSESRYQIIIGCMTVNGRADTVLCKCSETLEKTDEKDISESMDM